MSNLEEIKIKIIKNGKIYNKLEKTYYTTGKPNKYFLIEENNEEKICAKHFKDYLVECQECHRLVNMKGNVLSVINKNRYLCKYCRNKGERNGMYGKKLSEEKRKQMSEYMKLHPSFKGRHHTKESKRLISEANKGKLSGEKNPMYGVNVYKLIEQRDGIEQVNRIKQKISELTKGKNNPFYGKHHTEKVKETLRKHCKSKKFLEMLKSKEYKKKLVEGMLNSQKLKDSRASKEYKEKLKKALENSESFNAYKQYRKTEKYRELKRKQAAKQIIRNLELLGKNDGKNTLFQILILKHVNILMN